MGSPPPGSAALSVVCKTPVVREVRLLQSSSSLGGRQFAPVSELALHELVEDVASALPGPNGDAWIVSEMPSPLGLPDFVALLGAENWFSARLETGTAPVLSETDCVVLSALHVGRSLAIDSLGKRLGWHHERLAPVVARLTKSGAALQSGGGALSLAPGLHPQGGLIAIEAKVKDWRRAVAQGRTYRTWSDNYVVLLGDVGPVALGRAQSAIAQDRAGLNINGKWVVRPASRRASRARRLQGFEYAFASLTSKPTFGSHK